MQLLFYAVNNADDTDEFSEHDDTDEFNELEFSVSLIKEKFYSGYQPFLMNFLRDKNSVSYFQRKERCWENIVHCKLNV